MYYFFGFYFFFLDTILNNFWNFGHYCLRFTRHIIKPGSSGKKKCEKSSSVEYLDLKSMHFRSINFIVKGVWGGFCWLLLVCWEVQGHIVLIMLRSTRILHIKCRLCWEVQGSCTYSADYPERYKDLTRLSLQSFNFRLSVLKQPFRREVEQV